MLHFLIVMLSVVMLNLGMLSVAFSYCYADVIMLNLVLLSVAFYCYADVIMLNSVILSVAFLIVMHSVIMLNLCMLSVAFSYCYAECRYAECYCTVCGMNDIPC